MRSCRWSRGRRPWPSWSGSTRAAYLDAHRVDLGAQVAAGSTPTPDASPHSWEAATLAAGAGLTAVDALAPRARATRRSAPCARPATTPRPTESMGFCLISNVAVVAAALADARRAGADRRLRRPPRQRHPGRRSTTTPACCTSRSTSGRCTPAPAGAHETGEGDGAGTTLNMPLPPGATGDVYLRGVRRGASPRSSSASRPTWLLISAGFDAPPRRPDHRPRPVRRRLRRLLTARSCELVPPGRLHRRCSRAATTSTPCRRALGRDAGGAGRGDARSPRRRQRRPGRTRSRGVARRRSRALVGSAVTTVGRRSLRAR